MQSAFEEVVGEKGRDRMAANDGFGVGGTRLLKNDSLRSFEPSSGYQTAYSRRIGYKAEFSGIVRPSPASVLLRPTVR